MRRGIPFALVWLLPGAAAAQSPPPLPGIIERVAPPEAPALGPRVAPPEPVRATGPGETRQVALGAVAVEGNTALGGAALRPAFAALGGRVVTLAEIETARLAVLGAYRDAGFAYVAVTALLEPRGEMAHLRFRVTEGFVAEVTLEGGIGPAERQVARFLDPLVGLRPLPNAAIERALLLASDIPGVTARGVLRPIAGEPGALHLVVSLERRAVSGFVNLDNRGYRLTGEWQGLLVAGVNGLTGFGERTEVSVLGTDGGGQGFVQVSEELFLGASGLRLRAFAGAGRATPGSALAAIGYLGETRIGGVGLSYPVVRSRPLNLTLTGGVEAFESTVEARTGAGAARVRQSRDAVRVVRLGVEGAALDAALGFAPAVASTTGLVLVSRGLEAFGASEDGARAGSEFGFSKVVAEVTRLQPLFVPAEGWLVSVQGTLAGQWSDDVLPPAERFFLGGNRLGRGFHAGQVAGDRAVAGSVELLAGRVFELPELRLGVQFYGFRDEGRAFDNGEGGVERGLASWGGGVRLQFDERVQVDVEGVRRMTRNPEGAGVTRVSADGVYARVLVRF